MMFFQDPSMLEFQTRLQDLHHSNNLKTMFVTSQKIRGINLHNNKLDKKLCCSDTYQVREIWNHISTS